ncbi:hypothetical protein AAHC03_021164 [Spirometra sp. Aus1]
MESTCPKHPNGKCSEMRPEMVKCSMGDKQINDCLYLVLCACTEYDEPEDLCATIKQYMDRMYGRNWHVVVGPQFGA